MQEMPMQVHREIAGLKIGITHHLPDKNWGRELIHIGEQKDFDRLVTNPSCDIAVYGHIHQQFFRYGTGGELIINPGSIGQPFFLEKNLRKDLRAMYAILEFDQMGLKMSILDGWTMMSKKNCNWQKTSIFLITKCIMKVWSMAFIIPTIMSSFMKLSREKVMI